MPEHFDNSASRAMASTNAELLKELSKLTNAVTNLGNAGGDVNVKVSADTNNIKKATKDLEEFINTEREGVSATNEFNSAIAQFQKKNKRVTQRYRLADYVSDKDTIRSRMDETYRTNKKYDFKIFGDVYKAINGSLNGLPDEIKREYENIVSSNKFQATSVKEFEDLIHFIDSSILKNFKDKYLGFFANMPLSRTLFEDYAGKNSFPVQKESLKQTAEFQEKKEKYYNNVKKYYDKFNSSVTTDSYFNDDLGDLSDREIKDLARNYSVYTSLIRTVGEDNAFDDKKIREIISKYKKGSDSIPRDWIGKNKLLDVDEMMRSFDVDYRKILNTAITEATNNYVLKYKDYADIYTGNIKTDTPQKRINSNHNKGQETQQAEAVIEADKKSETASDKSASAKEKKKEASKEVSNAEKQEAQQTEAIAKAEEKAASSSKESAAAKRGKKKASEETANSSKQEAQQTEAVASAEEKAAASSKRSAESKKGKKKASEEATNSGKQEAQQTEAVANADEKAATASEKSSKAKKGKKKTSDEVANSSKQEIQQAEALAKAEEKTATSSKKSAESKKSKKKASEEAVNSGKQEVQQAEAVVKAEEKIDEVERERAETKRKLAENAITLFSETRPDSNPDYNFLDYKNDYNISNSVFAKRIDSVVNSISKNKTLWRGLDEQFKASGEVVAFFDALQNYLNQYGYSLTEVLSDSSGFKGGTDIVNVSGKINRRDLADNIPYYLKDLKAKRDNDAIETAKESDAAISGEAGSLSEVEKSADAATASKERFAKANKNVKESADDTAVAVDEERTLFQDLYKCLAGDESRVDMKDGPLSPNILDNATDNAEKLRDVFGNIYDIIVQTGADGSKVFKILGEKSSGVLTANGLTVTRKTDFGRTDARDNYKAEADLIKERYRILTEISRLAADDPEKNKTKIKEYKDQLDIIKKTRNELLNIRKKNGWDHDEFSRLSDNNNKLTLKLHKQLIRKRDMYFAGANDKANERAQQEEQRAEGKRQEENERLAMQSYMDAKKAKIRENRELQKELDAEQRAEEKRQEENEKLAIQSYKDIKKAKIQENKELQKELDAEQRTEERRQEENEKLAIQSYKDIKKAKIQENKEIQKELDAEQRAEEKRQEENDKRSIQSYNDALKAKRADINASYRNSDIEITARNRFDTLETNFNDLVKDNLVTSGTQEFDVLNSNLEKAKALIDGIDFTKVLSEEDKANLKEYNRILDETDTLYKQLVQKADIENKVKTVSEVIGSIDESKLDDKSKSSLESLKGELERIKKVLNEIDFSKVFGDKQKREATELEKSLGRITKEASKFSHNTIIGDVSHNIVGLIARYASYIRIFQRLINSFSQGYQALKQYDAAMTNIRYTMDMTESQFDSLGKSSIQMARDLNMSVENAIQISQIYANMQTTPEEILEIGRPTGVLANLAGISTSEASNEIQSVMNQFKLAADEAEHIVDVYDKVSANIKMDYASGIKSIASGVQAAGSVANDAGLSFEQLAAIVAKTAERTREEGGSIGQSIKTIATRISKASKLSGADEVDNETLSNASKALNDVGVAVYNANGSFRELDVILKELSDVWDTLTDAQRANISFQVAATRQSNKFRAILDSWTASEKLAAEATTAHGNAMANQEKYAKSIQGLLQSISTEGNVFWMKFLDSDLIKGFFEALDSGLTELNNNVGSGAGLLAAFSGAGTFVGGAFVKTFLSAVGKELRDKKNADGLGSALSSALPILKAGAIPTAVLASLALIVYWIDKYNTSVEKASQNANKQAAQVNSQTASLRSYGDEIKKLKDSIDSQSLSDSELFEAKKKLHEIQQKLEEDYGVESGYIDTLNDSYDLTIEKLKQVQKEKEIAWADEKQEIKKGPFTTEVTNRELAKEAADKYYNSEALYTETTSTVDYDRLSERFSSAIENAFIQAGAELFTTDVNSTPIYSFDGNLQERSDAISNAIENLGAVETVNEEEKEYLSEIIGILQNNLGDVQSGIDDTLPKITQNAWSRLANTEYDQVYTAYKAYNEKVEELKTAYEDGDEKKIAELGEQINLLVPIINDFESKFPDYRSYLLRTNDATIDPYRNRYELTRNESFKQLASGLKESGIDSFSLMFDKSIDDGIKTTWESIVELSDDYGFNASEVLDILKQEGYVLDKIVDDSKKLEKTDPRVSLIDKMTGLNNGMDILANIYKDIQDGGDFNFKNLSSKNFTDNFPNLKKEYEAFINEVSKSPDKMTDGVQNAFNALIDAFVHSEEVEKALKEGNVDLAASYFKMLGITNAQEYAQSLLTQSYLDASNNAEALALQEKALTDTGSDLVNWSNAEREAFLDINDASELARYALLQYAFEQSSLQDSSLSFDQQIDELYALAESYLGAAAAGNLLLEVLKGGQVGPGGLSYIPNDEEGEIDRNPIDLKSAMSRFYDDVFSVKPNYGGAKSPSNSGGGGDNTGTKAEYEWIKRAIEASQRKADLQREIMQDETEDYNKRLGAYENLTAADEEHLNNLREEEKLNSKAIDDAEKEVQRLFDADTAADLIKKAETGSLDPQTYRDTFGKKEITNEQKEAIDELNEKREEEWDIQDRIRQFEKQKHEDSLLYYDVEKERLDSQISKLQEVIDLNNSIIDMKDTIGELVNVSDYDSLINASLEIEDSYRRRIELLNEELDKVAQEKGVNSKEYMDLEGELRDTESSIRDCQKQQEEWNQAIRRIPIELLDKYISQLDLIKADIQNFMDIEAADGLINTAEEYGELVKIAANEMEHYVKQQKLLNRELGNYEWGSEKYQETYEQIKDIDSTIASIVKEMKEWNQSILNIPVEKLNKVTETLQSAFDAMSDLQGEYDTTLSAVSDLISHQTKLIQKEADATQKSYDKQIESIQDIIDALEKENEARQKNLAVEQAEYNLAKAEAQKTVGIIQDGMLTYVADQEAIRDAQRELDQAQYDYNVYTLQKQIDDLTEERDKLLKEYDERVDALNEIADKWSEIAENIKLANEALVAIEYLGDGWQEKVLTGTDAEIYASFKGMYERLNGSEQAYEKQITVNTRIANLMEQYIKAYTEGTITYEEALSGISLITAQMSDGVMSATEQLNSIQKLLGGGEFATILLNLQGVIGTEVNSINSYYALAEKNNAVIEKYTQTWEELVASVDRQTAELERLYKHADSESRDVGEGHTGSRVVGRGYKFHNGVESGYVGGSKFDKLSAFRDLTLKPLEPGEVPAILKKGELVFTKNQQNTLLGNVSRLAGNQFPTLVSGGTSVVLNMSNLTFHEINNGQDFANFISRNLSSAIQQNMNA